MSKSLKNESFEEPAQEGPDRDWLRIVLNREKCKKLSPEARLAVLYGLIADCQKRGVERVLRRSRIKLVSWCYVTWAVAFLRMICMTAIAQIIWELRYDHLVHLHNFRKARHKNLVFKMISQALPMGIAFCAFASCLEFLLILSFYVQRSDIIAFLYAVSLVAVLLILMIGPFMIAFHMNSYQLVADMYAYILDTNDVYFEDVASFQKSYKCCGFESPKDWFSPDLFRVQMLFSGEIHKLHNNFIWLTMCTERLDQKAVCVAPPFCCEDKAELCFISFNESRAAVFNLKTYENKSEFAYSYYKEKFHDPPYDQMISRGCFAAIAEAIDQLIWSSYKWILFLAIFTTIMTALVIVILLYNSGQGELFPHLNTVRSPHRNSLVWFFIKLDGKQEKFNDEDLTDFSIIEEVKNFDIDKDLTDLE